LLVGFQKIYPLASFFTWSTRLSKFHSPGDLLAVTYMLASPFGPRMGITKSAFPEELTSEIFPVTKSPSLMGVPRAAMTAELEFARATAPEQAPDDFIIPKIVTTNPPTITNTTKHKSGTSHFQFRPIQSDGGDGRRGRLVGSGGGFCMNFPASLDGAKRLRQW